MQMRACSGDLRLGKIFIKFKKQKKSRLSAGAALFCILLFAAEKKYEGNIQLLDKIFIIKRMHYIAEVDRENSSLAEPLISVFFEFLEKK